MTGLYRSDLKESLFATMMAVTEDSSRPICVADIHK